MAIALFAIAHPSRDGRRFIANIRLLGAHPMRQLFTCFGFALGAGALVGCGNGADADGKGDLLLPAPTSVDGMQGSEQALPPAQGPGGVAQNGTAAPGVPAPAGTQFADPAAFAPAPGAVGGIVADDVENSGASSVPE